MTGSGVNGNVLTIFKATSRFTAHGRRLFHHCARCSQPLLRASRAHHLTISTALLAVCLTGSAHAAAITLESSTSMATAGYFQLRWQAQQAISEYVLQESTNKDFTTAKIIYRGSDTATVISGKPDNIYFYRVSDRYNPANTSNTLKITVAHHPLRDAFAFFTVGAVVFIATLLLILRGNRQGQ
ncbi:MAG: hypothetical protein PVH46_01000 [Granulosicoccaceae bacterium]